MTDPRREPRAGVSQIEIDGQLPLRALITSKLDTLNVTLAGLARRMGYLSTPEKGVRRLEALAAGDLTKYANLKAALAKALAVSEEELDEAAETTRYVLWVRDDRDYRRAFSPHAIWDTEFRVPRPLAIAGAIGAQRCLYFALSSANQSDWSEEATAFCPAGVPCYGRVYGFWINYGPHCAVRFDRQGQPMEVMGHAVRPGYARTLINGRAFAPLQPSNAAGRYSRPDAEADG